MSGLIPPANGGEVESINHTSVAVNDVAVSKAWYTELLGLNEIIDNRTKDFPPGFRLPPDPLMVHYGDENAKSPCRLECDGMEVTLFERPEPLNPEEVARSRGVFHYSYRMNYDKVYELCHKTDKLRDKGYNVPSNQKRLCFPTVPPTGGSI